MSNKKIDLKILAKRIELLELRVSQLDIVNTDAVAERFAKIEDKFFVTKEVLSATEAAQFLNISLSQLYKFTCFQEIPHYKPRGKMVYFDRKELIRWMRRGHIRVPEPQSEETDSDKVSATSPQSTDSTIEETTDNQHGEEEQY